MSLYEVATLVLAAALGIGSAALTAWFQGRQAKEQRRHGEAQRFRDDVEKRRLSLINYERALREEASRTIEPHELLFLGEALPRSVQSAMQAAYPYFLHLQSSEDGRDRGMYWRLFTPGRGENDVPGYVESLEEAANAVLALLQRLDGDASGAGVELPRTSQE